MSDLPLLQIIIYSLTLWFGLYLIARDFNKPGLRYAGLGLVTYAIGLAIVVLFRAMTEDGFWLLVPIMLPAIFWMNATLYLIPDVPVNRVNINIVLAMLGVMVVALVFGVINPALARWIIFLIPPFFIIGALIRVRQAMQTDLPRRPLLLLFAATIFFGLSAGLIILPLGFFRTEWTLLAISFDIVLLGVVLAVLDAHDEGTSLLPDAVRSFAAAMLGVLIFGGQVVLVMAIMVNTTRPMMLLLFGLITSLLLIQAFFDNIQSLLDGAIFTSEPQVKQERDTLRAVSTAIARVDDSYTFEQMDEAEFTRLTRKALSHYSDLNKLASNPLIRIPLIDERLDEQGDNVLSRANELKSILRESIEHLKPDTDSQFSSTDEWRYYNVLYFPYVLGIKPYSRRYYPDDVDPHVAAAMEWFKTYVPERTLYNWQKTAAQLVAQHLREQLYNTPVYEN
jgi:hypothetical protein